MQSRQNQQGYEHTLLAVMQFWQTDPILVKQWRMWPVTPPQSMWRRHSWKVVLLNWITKQINLRHIWSNSKRSMFSPTLRPLANRLLSNMKGIWNRKCRPHPQVLGQVTPTPNEAGNKQKAESILTVSTDWNTQAHSEPFHELLIRCWNERG